MRAKAIVVLTFLLFSISSGQAATQKVLYTFTGGSDGGQPYAGVIFDPAGNLYGVTEYGGDYGLGTVFQLTPSPGGAWTETVLHSFTGGPDGDDPIGGLAIDEAGNLYGTTGEGGQGGSNGCGTVFKLSPSDSGWTFTVLHSFTGGNDGCAPVSNLGYHGNTAWVFGTTLGGGRSDAGTRFGLPTSGDTYEVTAFNGKNGNEPWGNFNIWTCGTTRTGGMAGYGNVYGPSWGARMRIVHAFKSTGNGGHYPEGELLTQLVGGVKTMYGTTSTGGIGGGGTVYRLTPNPNITDAWLFSVLYSFSGPDGRSPHTGLTADSAGNLYGTTSWGGTDPGNGGTVFKLTPGPKKKWTHTLLYSFTDGMDGGEVYSGVVFDNAGNLYGTTRSGGAYDNGVVYEVTP